MKVFVTKADNDYWYEIKAFNTMEDIQQFIEESQYEIIIEINPYTNDIFFECWDDMRAEDIPIIKQCPLHIIIYNEYIE